jgi:putative integral membrane protein (TIGR02587 family)
LSKAQHEAGREASVAAINPDRARAERDQNAAVRVSIARAFGGAIIFALPFFMTMEMWELGFHIGRYRLFLLLVLIIPILVFLAHYSGFEDTFDWREDLRDVFIAYGIAIVASTAVLLMVGILGPGMPLREIVGKIAIQAVPASIGALLARSQLGQNSQEPQGARGQGYWSELVLMACGALFLSLNVAPTEEMLLIATMMTPWHAVATILVSLLIMHAFVFASDFKGGSALEPGKHLRALLSFTLPGYVLALAVSLYMLWTFGHTDGLGPTGITKALVVMCFPASIGAAAARLIL